MMHLGIDLSKVYFDATLRKSDEQKVHVRCDNDAAGFETLDKWLQAAGVTTLHACMERSSTVVEGAARGRAAALAAGSAVEPSASAVELRAELRAEMQAEQQAVMPVAQQEELRAAPRVEPSRAPSRT